jgi:hypothetical protein
MKRISEKEEKEFERILQELEDPNYQGLVSQSFLRMLLLLKKLSMKYVE